MRQALLASHESDINEDKFITVRLRRGRSKKNISRSPDPRQKDSQSEWTRIFIVRLRRYQNKS